MEAAPKGSRWTTEAEDRNPLISAVKRIQGLCREGVSQLGHRTYRDGRQKL